MGVLDQALFERIVELRRDLHRHPELSWKETRTASRICAFLEELGIEYREDIAGTGVFADIPANTDAPAIALRADTDALPIHEETGLPFSSEVDGVMHEVREAMPRVHMRRSTRSSWARCWSSRFKPSFREK